MFVREFAPPLRLTSRRCRRCGGQAAWVTTSGSAAGLVNQLVLLSAVAKEVGHPLRVLSANGASTARRFRDDHPTKHPICWICSTLSSRGETTARTTRETVGGRNLRRRWRWVRRAARDSLAHHLPGGLLCRSVTGDREDEVPPVHREQARLCERGNRCGSGRVV
jgi:hypothetical protein